MEWRSERLPASPGVCVGVHVCLPIPLEGCCFFFGSAVFGDVSFPTVMHKMFGLPVLIILQNNGMRLAAAARSSDVCHTLSRARCLRNWLLLFPGVSEETR